MAPRIRMTTEAAVGVAVRGVLVQNLPQVPPGDEQPLGDLGSSRARAAGTARAGQLQVAAADGPAYISPARAAQAAAAAREERSSLRRMFARCRWMVCSLSAGRCAMSELLNPCATSLSTATSGKEQSAA